MELNPENASLATSGTGNRLENIDRLLSNTHPDREDSDPSDRNDDSDDSNNDDDEWRDVAPPLFDRSPPPELDDDIRAPLQGLNPNVLGIGGMQNLFARGQHGHMWGEGVKLGAVEHNPHAIDPVLRAQTPGESAVRRLEMRQHHQLQAEAGKNS